MNWENGVSWICDFAMSTVFAASAYGKSGAMTDMRMEIYAHRLLPERLVPAAALATLGGEYALAASFGIGGMWEGVKEPVALAALIAMSWLTWRRRRSSGAMEACGCFGANHPLGRNPLLRNMLLMAIVIAAWLLPRPAASGGSLLAFVLAVAAAVRLLEARKLQAETGETGAGRRRRTRAHG